MKTISVVCQKGGVGKTTTVINIASVLANKGLKTLIIESECFIKFIKFIFEGPKYLDPLIEGIGIKSFSIFFNDPEKLFQVDFSLIIFSTVDFGKQV